MKKEASRRVPEDQAASLDDIERAIQSLTIADVKRLEAVARNRISVLGRKAMRRDHMALVLEALERFKDGRRRWNLEKSFLPVLIGAVMSIATEWAKAYDPQEDFVLESEQPQPLQAAKSPDINGEERLIAMEEHERCRRLLEELQRHFADDKEATDVIDGWRAEMTGPEIQSCLDWSVQKYETVVTRIRRKARTKAKHLGNGYVQ